MLTCVLSYNVNTCLIYVIVGADKDSNCLHSPQTNLQVLIEWTLNGQIIGLISQENTIDIFWVSISIQEKGK